MQENSIEKLGMWQRRYAESLAAYESELAKMEERESLWRGDYMAPGEHLRNLVSELIETQIDGSIPQPKVTARRECDREKAALIEGMLRCELDRLPMERINDIVSRMVLLQGGGYYLVEWDSAEYSPLCRGEVAVTALHPRRVVPQEGIFSDIEDMDYIFLRLPESAESIYSRFGVRLGESDIGESIKGYDGEDMPQSMALRIVAYYKSTSGIGMFSWVGDTVICDMPDYESRSLYRCSSCGRICQGDVCRVCGGSASLGGESYEKLSRDVIKSDGSIYAKGEILPYYKNRKYPIVLQKNVSVWGQLLGESDCDRIAHQQYTTNSLERKIREKLLTSGSFVTLPDDASIDVTGEEMRVVRIANAADKALIDVYDLEGDIEQDMEYLSQVYEEARQIIGVTDSYQGRRDNTAISGSAKKFSAEMSAGRFRSKKVMKKAAFSQIFELIFRLKLAYCDDIIPVISGEQSGAFSRYDFIEGEGDCKYYNDMFVFSCDIDEPLSLDRERMWEEIRRAYEGGAFGDPQSEEARSLYWEKLREQHYPLR